MNGSGAVEDGLELPAGGPRVMLGHADRCGRVADLADGGLPAVEGGESCPRLADHPEPGPGRYRPGGHTAGQRVLADHVGLHLPGGGELLQRLVVVAARRLENGGGKAHQQVDAGLAVDLRGAPGAV